MHTEKPAAPAPGAPTAPDAPQERQAPVLELRPTGQPASAAALRNQELQRAGQDIFAVLERYQATIQTDRIESIDASGQLRYTDQVRIVSR